MPADAAQLELAYRYAAAAYRFAERRCHDDVAPARVAQRDITRWSLEIVRGARSAVQTFTNLLIQYPQNGTNEPGQIRPDNTVFVHPLAPGESYNTPLQPVGPFLVLEYVSKASARKDEETSYAKYERELKVPYYLLFYPDADEFTLFRLGETGYTSVVPNAFGRCPIPELELEVGQLGRWVRYWFRGELLPLPGDLLKERDDARRQLDAERQARQAAEAELAKLREELAKAKGQE
ncbi:Uma2 family endonuclease [Gemmata sp. JC717]|uniref:Uma2 family endonuclease n=1 Tax=Gemmata algarum TaxID=2975278 RepID=UPI0021BB68DC|nr:Uma2 family endonuclease [Gemmata algarum]MDY3552040.1 Uma2 family endonuclease [Gemmata algarum]